MGVLALDASAATLTPVVTALDTVVSVAGTVFTFMTGNPYLVVLMAGGLLSLGIRMFRKAKGAAR